jgi:hypothetical protein
MRLLQIRAPKEDDVACLMRELASYAPEQRGRSILVELEDRSNSDLMGLLSAAETCIAANDIRSVRIELDGQKYTLAPN